jgi:KUP system potassium uptake protein
MLVWFLTLGLLGLIGIVHSPDVLRALDPRWGLGLFAREGWGAFVALGAIVLAITGAEALYADMGHFGRRPIRFAWFGMVLPCLVLNYFGQGALVLHTPAALDNPFYRLAPAWALIPLIGLATLATVIASQAVISGVFSLTRQAIQLGHLPRMTIRHTSATEIGQIYIPRVNWLLMLGVLLLVLGFRSSGNLASAYGISVTSAMAIDAILAGVVAAGLWRWGWWALPVFGALLLIDLVYVASNMLKIPSGGWFPLLLAIMVAGLMRVWRRGRKVLWNQLYDHALTVTSFIERLDSSLIRVAGTAIFMTGNPRVLPRALLHNIKHNKVLHERVVFMTVRTTDEPTVADAERLEIEDLGRSFHIVTAAYGFRDEPDIPRALELCRTRGLEFDMMRTSFFLGRETLIPSTRPEMGPIEERVYMILNASALAATAYFRIPPDRVVELGTQVEI